MQTFLPQPSLDVSTAVLDDRRLNKQITETWQISQALLDPDYGWQNHPAVRMWRGHVGALCLYGVTAAMQWVIRGFAQHSLTDPLTERMQQHTPLTLPEWWGDDRLHLSHRSNLIRKNPAHYGRFFPHTPHDLPYYWPV